MSIPVIALPGGVMPAAIRYAPLASRLSRDVALNSVLARLLPDLHVQRFAGIHHFTPAEEIYAGGHVRALRELWAGAVPAPSMR